MTSAPGSQEQAHGVLSSAPYILRPLISDVPLSADGDQANIRITCVEVLSMDPQIPFVSYSDLSKTKIYTLALQPGKFSTSFRYHQIQPTPRDNRTTSSHRDSSRQQIMTRVTGMVFSRSCFYQQYIRLVS